MVYLSKIKKQIDDFSQKDFEVNDGYSFNVPQILRKIDLYNASRFVRNPKDKDGFKKIFLNINKHRRLAASKAVDIDTKHIKSRATDSGSYYVSWIFDKELKEYLKENGYAELFNKWAEKWPLYGHICAKDVNGVPQDVSIKNLVWDARMSIERSPYVHEKILYTYDEFENTAVELGWENYEEVLSLYAGQSKDVIQVVESYLFVPSEEIEGEEPGKLVKARVITAGMEFYKPEKDGEKAVKPITLDYPTPAENPYLDLAWDEEDGRGFGVGVVEDLFLNQESVNEIQTLKRKSMHWNSKIVFQTRDNTAPSNLFTRVQNGQVLTSVQDDLRRVDMGDRALGDYSLEFNLLEKNSDDRAFSPEVATGESLPSGTPFRLGAILSNAVNSHFAFKREKLGLFIKRIINEFAIPKFKAEKKQAHTVSFSGDARQMQTLRRAFAEVLTTRAINQAMEQGIYPTGEAIEAFKEQAYTELAKKDELFFEAPENIYEDIEKKIDIVITGESVNVESNLTTLTTVWQVLAQQGDQRANDILEMILNESGQNPKGILGVGGGGGAPQQQMAQMGMQGLGQSQGQALPNANTSTAL